MSTQSQYPEQLEDEQLQRFYPQDVHLYHKNPRKGKVDEIAKSLRVLNQYKPILVNRGTHTGRPDEVLAGNHTVKAIRDLAAEFPGDERWKSVLAYVIDVDDDQAARIVAVDNKSADMGTYDDEMLADLLSGLPDLEGTGYTDAELLKLLGGKPIEGDAPTEDSPVAYGVVVECDTEDQQVMLLERLDEEGFRVRALM